MSRDKFALTGADKGGVVESAFLDAFHKGFHRFIILNLKRMALEWIQVGMVDIYDLLRSAEAGRIP